jgi:hypothetical protein
MSATKFTKGQKVKITGNEIFSYMGLKTVTGEVFLVRADGSGATIKCKETGAMETADFDDGIWVAVS